ncbi:hypothetical protein ACLKA6_019971 [Drosophila palustris]
MIIPTEAKVELWAGVNKNCAYASLHLQLVLFPVQFLVTVAGTTAAQGVCQQDTATCKCDGLKLEFRTCPLTNFLSSSHPLSPLHNGHFSPCLGLISQKLQRRCSVLIGASARIQSQNGMCNDNDNHDDKDQNHLLCPLSDTAARFHFWHPHGHLSGYSRSNGHHNSE